MTAIRKGILPIVLLTTWSTGSSGDDGQTLQSLRWLLGTWVTDGGENVTEERWTEVSPNTFEGLGQTRSRATDTPVSHESLRLVEMSGEVFYVAKVGHNDVPIAFKLTSVAPDRAVFENPQHDFPKRLEYQRTGDRLVVTVTDGGTKGFALDFSRVAGE